MLDAAQWLRPLEALRLECDGMTRVISALLERDAIAYSPMVGRLTVDSVGQIPVHHWIELTDGRRIDLRARMWLGTAPKVPHGLVSAQLPGVVYQGRAYSLDFSPVVFWALTGAVIEAFAPPSFLYGTSGGTPAADRAAAPAQEVW